MRVLNVLAREHQAIARVVDRLDGELDSVTRRGTLDTEVFERLLEFLEPAVDGHHQESQERVLLPRLLARATCAEDADRARMLLHDHAAQRTFLALLRDNFEGAGYGDPTCLVPVARQYVRLQREHTRWERRLLFPLARRMLGRTDDLELLVELRRLDQAWGATVIATASELEDWLDQRRVAA